MTNDIIDQIQAQGERITLPRRLVIEALGQSHQHLTIGQIQQNIQERSPSNLVSDTTVYRVLQWLKDLQLVSQTDMGQLGTVYALTTHLHHHLICLKCGSITTIPDDIFISLRQQLHHDYGFEARIEHMAIYGHCAVCRDSNSV